MRTIIGISERRVDEARELRPIGLEADLRVHGSASRRAPTPFARPPEMLGSRMLDAGRWSSCSGSACFHVAQLVDYLSTKSGDRPCAETAPSPLSLPRSAAVART